jgi:hypothetical protein
LNCCVFNSELIRFIINKKVIFSVFWKIHHMFFADILIRKCMGQSFKKDCAIFNGKNFSK